MQLSTTLVLAVIACGSLAPATRAQVVDRTVDEVLIGVGSAPGLYDVGARVSVSLGAGAAPGIDMGSEYRVYVNEAEVNFGHTRPGHSSTGTYSCPGSPPPCSGGCPSYTWDNETLAGFCTNKDGVCVCRWANTKPNLATDLALQVGDVVRVQVFASPGSVPDADLTDDSASKTFGPTIVALNRRVRHVILTPGSSPGLYNIGAEVSATVYSGDAPIDFSSEYRAFVNEIQVGIGISRSGIAPAGPATCYSSSAPCSGDCPMCFWDGVGYGGTCTSSLDGCGCDWARTKSNIANDVPLSPGDVVRVEVVAAPGSLPELRLTDDSASTTFGVVPAMSSWGLATLAAVLGLGGVWMLRARRVAERG